MKYECQVPEECAKLLEGAKSYRKFEIDGVVYQKGEAIVNDELMEVMCMSVKRGAFVFLLRFVICSYDYTLCAFRVERTVRFKIACHADLRAVEPLGLYEVCGKLYAVPRHLLRHTGMM